MPKITFFNLPENKKQILIEAVRKEFSRVPLYDASIANIVKSAKIPRGSFYQYFEDKEDAFFFLLNDLTQTQKKHFIQQLADNQGDIFQTMVDNFQMMIKEEENLMFMKNALLNMSHKIESTFGKIFSDIESINHLNELIRNVNKSNLNISSDQELFQMMQIIKAVTLHHLVDKFARDLTFEEALHNYTLTINMLKKGLSR